MPIVHIDLMKGRPEQALAKMISAVSDAIATSLEAPIESVRVIVNEMEPHQYGVAGKAWPEVLEERRNQQEEQA